MQLKEIYETVDRLAPFALSKEYCAKFGAYDNSGVLVDCGGEHKKLLFSLDLTSEAVRLAEREGADCILTHHPAIFRGLLSVKEGGEGGALLRCIRAGISVLSAHLNLDCAEGGIDDALMRGLNGEAPLAVKDVLSGGGYGRVYDVPETDLSAFSAHIRETFRTSRLLTYGEGRVKRVASFCGAGLGEGELDFAKEHGADTVVSSDAKHHLLVAAAEAGLNTVLLTHYAAENYGFMRFAHRVAEVAGLPAVYFTDERFL